MTHNKHCKISDLFAGFDKVNVLIKCNITIIIYAVIRNFFIAVFLLLTSSCIRMGDGAFVVQGEMVNLPADSKCLLSLVVDDEITASPWKVVEVDKNFYVDFTVSPYSKVYQVKISCNGKLVASKFVKYPQEMGVGGVVNIGKINAQW